MKIAIKNLTNDEALLEPLTHVYRRSYNTLSKAYKSPEEMALYTNQVFYHKLKRFAKESESNSNAQTFVVMGDDRPVGFVRYSLIPDYYKNNVNGETRDKESGVLDGYEYAWYRKVKFVDDVKLDNSTMILNQIYLDPSVQRHGLGTYVLSKTLPKIKEQGIKNLILEYNTDNKNAEKFYHAFGFRALADTQDLDHILDVEGKAKLCISDVKMVQVPVDVALEKANAKMEEKRQIHSDALGNLVYMVQQSKAK